jgi:hypothetical protein
MSELFIPSKGCVYIARRSRTGSGFYDLKPVLRGYENAPILLDGVDGGDQDIVFPVVTLDDKKFLFSMGEDFGKLSITGMACLGKSEQGGKSFASVVSYFQRHRVSRSSAPITISFPGNVSQKAYPYSLVVAKPDAEFHIQYFQIQAIVATPLKA